MLGEKLGEESGQVTVQRVLPAKGQGPAVEASFQTSGTLLGVATTDIGTYQSFIRPDGNIQGRNVSSIMRQL
jgi:hypothetical protein